MGISALLFVLILDTTGSHYAFVLLPVFLSLLINGPRYFNIKLILESTPLYFLLTAAWALVYYGFITAFIVVSHPGINDPIIFVTVALAWTVILGPAHSYVQTLIEQRYNARNRKSMQAVESFTSTLREEIDLDQLRERFLTLLQETMSPYSASLWVRSSWQRELASLFSPSSTVPPDVEMIEVNDADALLTYLLNHVGVTEISQIQTDSPLLEDVKARAMEQVVPLVSQSELIGMLGLGPRQDGMPYSRADRSLLASLVVQVAPALRVAQMVLAQQEQVRERERIEQELRTARAIQQTFLPKEVPALSGWQLTPYYHPAREVGGDFYDFLLFENGCLGIVIGDVTGKGVPAALVMATTHTMLRTATQQSASPGEALTRINDLLYADTLPAMFVTCFYALLDPRTGKLRFANAGHDLPFRQVGCHAAELWATGMPLGLMPGTRYDEYETTLQPGENLLFYSDGLVEAHNMAREMFGLPRLQKLLERRQGELLIDDVLGELARFTGDGWEQEDDVTLVALQRSAE
jgi:serine phosphatase RsbU (regulator of sigma subunit)